MVKRKNSLINRSRIIDLFFILVVVIATFFAWHGILNQTIEGEGFYYFAPSTSLINSNGRVADLLHGIDNFVKIVTFVQEKTFKGNIQPYMNVELIFIIIINISFYVFLRKVTKNSALAFLASIYEAVYYTGNFQFFARGSYHWFYQRAVETIPVFVSLYFLISFAKSKKIRHYILSLGFFVFALFCASYTTFLTPFVPIYLAIYSIVNVKGIKEKIKLISFSIPFILINYYLTRDASLNLSVIHPHETFIESFLMMKDTLPKILHQLVVVTVPFGFTDLLSRHFNTELIPLVTSMVVPVCLFYLFIFGTLYKRRSKYFILSLSSFFSLLAVLFLVVYFNRVKAINEIQEGRYYYIPGFYVGIIFSTFLVGVVNKYRKLIFSCLAIIWILSNSQYIWTKMDATQIYYTQSRTMLDFLNKEKKNIPENSIVFVPNPPAPGAVNFLDKYYSGINTSYLYLDVHWKENLPKNVDVNKIFVFDYDPKNKLTVIDRTQEYRNMLTTTP